jgi:hypothetical protein
LKLHEYKPEAQASGYFRGFPDPSLARRACIGTLRFFNFHVFYQLECEILSQMCNFKERERGTSCTSLTRRVAIASMNLRHSPKNSLRAGISTGTSIWPSVATSLFSRSVPIKTEVSLDREIGTGFAITAFCNYACQNCIGLLGENDVISI